MKVLTVQQMRDFEKYTMKSSNLKEIDLMRKAGNILAKDFIEKIKPNPKAKIKVFAGIGNNGGDALKVAIELQKSGYDPKVFVVGEVNKASDAFLYYFDLVGKVEIIDNLENVNNIQERIFEADYIIEGLFGIGLTREVKGYIYQLIDYINRSDTIVYSIDIPSGINPNNGLVMGIAVKAQYTGVIGYYKLGNLLNDAMDYHGKIELLDIGILEEYIVNTEVISLDDYKLETPKRLHKDNKYTCGLGVFVGGKKSMMGSIQMAAYSGLKSGLGISYIISDLIDNHYTQFYPELIIQDINQECNEILRKAKSVVYGPGLSQNKENDKLLETILKSNTNIVIDASGLEKINLSKKVNNNIVLTPHTGELSRLLNISKEEILQDSLKYLSKLTKLGYTVLLKGACNIIMSETKTILIQVTNTGLATAGSGDVLSGIIAANFDSKEVLESLVKSVYIHTKASLYAKEEVGEISLVATDIINNISKVLR